MLTFFNRNLEEDERVVIEGGGKRTGIKLLEILRIKRGKYVFRHAKVCLDTLDGRGLESIIAGERLEIAERVYVRIAHKDNVGRKVRMCFEFPIGYKVEYYGVDGELKRLIES